MQIPLLNGVYADTAANLRTSYPRNLVPVPKESGISKGYLKPADGLVSLGLGPGIDRGAINWNGTLYRAMGDRLVTIGKDGTLTILGYIGNDNFPVTFAYSFDRLAIVSNQSLYYYNGVSISQVNDVDLGLPISVIWVDGYFLMTDGTSVYVTDLADPMSINPLKYGSAETDPDNISLLLKYRNEAVAVGRYTIEFLQDVGGSLFPFQRIDGAEIMRGAIGRRAACFFADQIAFLGSGKNEPLAVYMGVNGLCTKISTAEIDKIIKGYPEATLISAVLETRIDLNHIWLYVRLPDQTLVYDHSSTQLTQTPVWFSLDSGLGAASAYRAGNFVWCYDQFNFGDPTSANYGVLSDAISSHFGADVSWQFGTVIIYNQSTGFIVHELELIALTGGVAMGADPTIWTSYSTDGVTWSIDRPRSVGKIGNRNKRLNWLMCGNSRNWRIQRFKGTSSAHISIMACEARIEALND
jgi:hypothetical protein